MNEDLIKKGKQIVSELGERPETLTKWMAHYVAELMERANSEQPTEAQTAAAQCAELILELWGKKLQEKAIGIRQQYWYQYNHISEENEELYERVKILLASPESANKSSPSDSFEILWCLSDVEHQLFELLMMAEVLNDSDKEDLDETVQVILETEAATNQACKQVPKLFPAFKDLSLTDLATIREQTTIALQSVDRLRHVLLWQEQSE